MPHALPISTKTTTTIAALLFSMAVFADATSVIRPDTRPDARVDEITVTSQRRDRPLLSHAGNVTALNGEAISAIGHQHANEILGLAAGTWVSRGSGQEHLTAIRSPVLTGAGSCGGFLMLEDGIPVRPSGFCNVNQLFEINTEQAATIEVIRGPGTALHGSNALHGIINVLTPTSIDAIPVDVALEIGANRFKRIRSQFSNDSTLLSLIYADDDGFRDASGYRQGKARLKKSWTLGDSDLTTVFSATTLDQETAGFILGQDAYKDSGVNRSNPNPEAFRDATSQRLYAILTTSFAAFELDLRPYLRHNDMSFLQHFLPGQPLEENGHLSAGVLAALSYDFDNRSLTAGVDLEWSDIYLRETQFGPTEGSAFLQATRPSGKHYDYDVRSSSIAPWLQFEFRASDALRVAAGVRLERLRYDYDNNMLSGNTRDDGSECGFGGCLYSRPASRSDTFHNVAPNIGANLTVNESMSLFVNLSRGFRAPQATELYRLQSGQSSAQLASERIDSLEIGLRRRKAGANAALSLFTMNKRGSVLRDSNGFNVNGGRSKHSGIETSFEWQLLETLRLRAEASYALHRYDFNLVAARGETFTSGNDIDTAPRWLASAELLLTPSEKLTLALHWTHVGDYYLDAENQFSYPGHDLVNARSSIELHDRLTLTARVNNVFDTHAADRADFAFGNYRYFPARGREMFVELRYAK